jgi:ABC-type antimicrobial peptide transport system permease subunit
VEIVGFYDYTQFRDGIDSPFICSREFFEEYTSIIRGDYAYVIASLKHDGSDLSLIKFGVEESDTVNYKIENDVTAQISFLNYTLTSISKIFVYAGLIFAFFSSVLLFSFISGNIIHRKREIGVLRAIGASGRDVFKIFLYEGLIISLINFLLSTISCIVICIIINQNLRDLLHLLISFLVPGIRQVMLLLIISVFVAFISTFLPIYRFSKKKPIDVIKEI